MASGPITSWQIGGETVETVSDFIFLGSKITANGDCSREIKRRLLLGRKVMTNLVSEVPQSCPTLCDPMDCSIPGSSVHGIDQPQQHIKKQRHYSTNKDLSSHSYGFSSDHVWMWELDYTESWVPMNWRFWTVVLEKTFESPLDSKEIKTVNPKGNQSSVFIGRTDAKAGTPVLWPPDAENWLIWKDPDSEKDWKQEKKGTI